MYDTNGEHLQAEFSRIDRVLDRALEDSRPSNENETGGQAVDLETATRAFAGTDDRVASDDESFRTDLRTLTEEIDGEVEDAREAGIDLRLDTLGRAFDLSRSDLDVLLFVLAPEIDRSITASYGTISGRHQPEFPTIDVLETLLGYLEPADRRTNDRSPLSPSSPLFEYGLLERSREPSKPRSYETLTVDERIVTYLKGDDALDPALADAVDIESHDRTLADLVFDGDTAETLAAVEERATTADAPTIFYLSGEDGTGKDRLPGALTDSGTPILRATAADVLADDGRTTRLLREAALQGATIHLEDLQAVTGHDDGPTIDEDDGEVEITAAVDRPSVDAIVERLDDAPGDVFLSHTESWKPDVDLEHHRVETARCPFPDYETRLAVWEEYREEFAAESLATTLATNFRLPQRDIRRAIETARYLRRTDADADELVPADRDEKADIDLDDDLFAPVDGALTREHCYEACKRYSASNLEALADPLEPGYSWEDIYLNAKTKTHLEELAGHLQYRGPVTSEWGFGEPGDRGDGVVALFYGQPGTGKTMAAEIIANETGLDLYRVDLSQVLNKYVGETESRLAALLDEAERSNAILLFDEADAIFGKRAEVKDATDRYANTEINFLLQRLESFDGIVLLTTNKEAGIDPAFKRRIDHAIEFRKPQERIRRELWRDAFPDDATVDTDDFDYEFLGRITATPAVIRKIAKYAAYIAATDAHDGRPLEDGTAAGLEDVSITFDHVVLALQYAQEAGGGGFEVDFREYEDKRRSYESGGVERDWRAELRRTYGNDAADTDADEE
ncbi:ATP-binding protein [Halopiger djelfimassiliensis]|uniref:ATP-binding protein n=1 Tax=Halopiger djelfimassiliensis TaxID=1293047 RepID=UPI000677F0A5|nr:AAA family ATPase [Halopiger djelfimassiliensis]